MVVEELLDFLGLVVGGIVEEENDAADFVSCRVRDKIAQVFAKLDISSSRKEVPDDALMGPKEGDEAVEAFVVAQGGDVEDVSFFRPTPIDFTEKFDPFLVLKPEEDIFFLRKRKPSVYSV